MMDPAVCFLLKRYIIYTKYLKYILGIIFVLEIVMVAISGNAIPQVRFLSSTPQNVIALNTCLLSIYPSCAICSTILLPKKSYFVNAICAISLEK